MEEHNFKKQFGQNFLRNIEWIMNFVEAAELDKDDLVVEIGPGDGAITNFVLQQVKELIAIEIDFDLVKHLSEIFEDYKNFKVIQADVLQWNVTKTIKDRKYKVVGALPYNISKQIIKKFFEQEHKPESLTFILQNEVALKYSAQAPKATFLSNYAALHADVEYVSKIPNTDFYPVPAVDGGIIHIRNFKNNINQELVRFIRLGFSQPRKKLSKNLSNYGYEKNDVEGALVDLGHKDSARAGELTIEQWQTLFDTLQINE